MCQSSKLLLNSERDKDTTTLLGKETFYQHPEIEHHVSTVRALVPLDRLYILFSKHALKGNGLIRNTKARWCSLCLKLAVFDPSLNRTYCHFLNGHSPSIVDTDTPLQPTLGKSTTTMEPTTQNDRDAQESTEFLLSAHAGRGPLPMFWTRTHSGQVFAVGSAK